jgi:hypothetical protein
MTVTPQVEALRSRMAVKLELISCERNAELKNLGIGTFTQHPTHLHHYTTADGVLGVLNRRVIYATSAQFLNDYSEGIYGLSVARDAIVPMMNQQTHFFESSFLNSILDNINHMDIRSNFYLVCFCEKRDLLSQRRGYAGRGGYSLDFRTAEMFESKVFVDCELVKVVYDGETQRRLITSVLQRYVAALREVFELSNSSFSLAINLNGPTHPALVELGKLVSSILNELVYLAAIFKSPTFQEESEWRLLSCRPPASATAVTDIKFRSAAGLLIPYVEIPIQITESSLASITCGPSSHGALPRKGVELLLAYQALQNVPVISTEIPLKR